MTVLTVTHVHCNVIRVRTMRATIHFIDLRRRFLRRREGWYWLQSVFVSDTGIFQGGPSSPTVILSAFIYNHIVLSVSPALTFPSLQPLDSRPLLLCGAGSSR